VLNPLIEDFAPEPCCVRNGFCVESMKVELRFFRGEDWLEYADVNDFISVAQSIDLTINMEELTLVFLAGTFERGVEGVKISAMPASATFAEALAEFEEA